MTEPTEEKDVHGTLAAWGESLCIEIAVGDLYARNPIVQKWKALFRSIMLREALMYRAYDLLKESVTLFDMKQILGARILLRSAFETAAVLIYLNQRSEAVLKGEMTFHDFSNATVRLLAGSKDQSTDHENVNILTILKHADKKFEGIAALYAVLSESAHPSFEGMMRGYVEIDHKEYVAKFGDYWPKRYTNGHMSMVATCMTTLDYEYNEVWPPLYEALEKFVEENDAELEATQPAD